MGEQSKFIYEKYTNIIFVPYIHYDGVLTHQEKYVKLLEELSLSSPQYVNHGIITSAIEQMRTHGYTASDNMRYNIDNKKIKLLYDIITSKVYINDINLLLGEHNHLDHMFYFYINVMTKVFNNLELTIVFLHKYSNHINCYNVKNHQCFIYDEILHDSVFGKDKVSEKLNMLKS